MLTVSDIPENTLSDNQRSNMESQGDARQTLSAKLLLHAYGKFNVRALVGRDKG